MMHFAVQQKLTYHCKATIFQLKKNLFYRKLTQICSTIPVVKIQVHTKGEKVNKSMKLKTNLFHLIKVNINL